MPVGKIMGLPLFFGVYSPERKRSGLVVNGARGFGRLVGPFCWNRQTNWSKDLGGGLQLRREESGVERDVVDGFIAKKARGSSGPRLPDRSDLRE
jgi:hypothetical protein